MICNLKGELQVEIEQMEVGEVTFGILSPEEILKMSVCEVKEVSKNRFQGVNTVYDERMGPIEAGAKCVTCGLDGLSCPGHPGYIKLNYPIIHPLHYKLVLSILKCVCFNCYRVLVTQEVLDAEGVPNELQSIVGYLEKNRICSHCSHIHPKLVMVQENIIYAVITTETDSRLEIHEEEIRMILENLTDEDATLIGFDINVVHPKNLVLSVLPVLPTCNRPSIQTDSIVADDDLTIQYIEIVKANKHLEDNSDKDKDAKKSKYIKSLKFRIKTLMDNSQGKAKRVNTGRCYQGIKERLSSKTGLVRGNLNGKRVNHSSRTVIGPDPLVPITHVVIPEDMALKLTIPIKVTDINMEEVKKLLDEDKINYVLRESEDGERIRYNMKYAMYTQGTKLQYGDVIVRDGNMMDASIIDELKPGDKLYREGREVPDLKFTVRKSFNLQIGDIVERQMRDGDWVLINRQPTQ